MPAAKTKTKVSIRSRVEAKNQERMKKVPPKKAVPKKAAPKNETPPKKAGIKPMVPKLPTELEANQTIWLWVDADQKYHPQTLVKAPAGKIESKTKISVLDWDGKKYPATVGEFVYETPKAKLIFVPPVTLKKGQIVWWPEGKAHYELKVLKVKGEEVTVHSVTDEEPDPFEIPLAEVVTNNPGGVMLDGNGKPIKSSKKKAEPEEENEEDTDPETEDSSDDESEKSKSKGKVPSSGTKENADPRFWKAEFLKSFKEHKFKRDDLGKTFIHKAKKWVFKGFDTRIKKVGADGSPVICIGQNEKGFWGATTVNFVRLYFDKVPQEFEPDF